MHFTDFLPCLVFVIGVALLLLAGERHIDRVACAKCNRAMHRRDGRPWRIGEVICSECEEGMKL
jgi:hypothetical protein